MKPEVKTIEELKSVIVDAINDGRLDDMYICDIHNEVFNTDYFIIGRYDAEQWLINNGGIFNAIETIKEYEQDNFGAVSTDLSDPERVCNMFVYILGEQVLNDLQTIKNNWDDRLNDELKEALLDELS